MTLPNGIWFVRSNGGNGSWPVTREGWLTVAGFVAGLIASGVLTFAFAHLGLWSVALFAIGAAISAGSFIAVASQHTDYTITHTEYVERNRPHA
jgi:hypothetical protein